MEDTKKWLREYKTDMQKEETDDQTCVVEEGPESVNYSCHTEEEKQ